MPIFLQTEIYYTYLFVVVPLVFTQCDQIYGRIEIRLYLSTNLEKKFIISSRNASKPATQSKTNRLANFNINLRSALSTRQIATPYIIRKNLIINSTEVTKVGYTLSRVLYSRLLNAIACHGKLMVRKGVIRYIV